MTVQNEFSAAFSAAFDATGKIDPSVVSNLPDYCWPVDWGCAQDFYDNLVTMPDPDNPQGPNIPDPAGIAVAERAEALATQTLRMLTAYQVGSCPITVRPCQRRCGGGSYLAAPEFAGSWAGAFGWSFRPYVQDGQWLNACGCATDDCSCTVVPEVPLPGPVAAVGSVYVDGVALESWRYRIDNGNMLVRTDGGSWPVCQDMTISDPEAGGFFVTYAQGAIADGLAAWAAGLLAVEYAKSCTGAKCRLPSGVSEVSRQGITMTIASGAFPDGMTGIREVDAFIQFWNPYGVKSVAQVFSPDSRRPRRTTWSA